jgi:filamentous hemagglutinin
LYRWHINPVCQCSTNRSVLEGALEVFGKNAAVVIANPNGFGCDGCSFINTSKLTIG